MDACVQVIAHAHVTGCGSEGSVAKRYIATVYGQANWSLFCAYQRHHRTHHPKEAEPKPAPAAAGLYQRVRCVFEQSTAFTTLPCSVLVGVKPIPWSACPGEAHPWACLPLSAATLSSRPYLLVLWFPFRLPQVPERPLYIY